MQPHTKIVGILNLTPDSFSNTSGYETDDAALFHALEMIQNNVHVIDIGAESTRPGATPLSPDEEWHRLEPLLSKLIHLAHTGGTQISIDTRHATTASYALALGVDWINDVSGLRNPAMLNVLSKATCNIVFMHSLSIPANPDVVVDTNENIIEILSHFAQETIEKCASFGITKERLTFDPGLGFGKTAEQSLEILHRIEELQEIALPLFIGHSRKSFLTKFSPAPASERDALTLAVSEYLLAKKVNYLRVHDVPHHMQLLKLHQCLHAPEP